MAVECDWTVLTLKEYLEKIFEEKDKALAAALAAADKTTAAALNSAKEAVTKAEESQLRVNISQNEFRGALKDNASTLMPRAEAEARMNAIDAEFKAHFKALEDRIGSLADKSNVRTGRSSGVNGVWVVAGIVFTIVLAAIGVGISVVR